MKRAELIPQWQTLGMRLLPVLRGVIKRRLLINFRVDPKALEKILPPPFYPKLHSGFGIAGICLIRLENIRPSVMPTMWGFSSENAAHRIAVCWRDEAGKEQEGVFIPRRDTGSRINTLIGGRLFPGEHHYAKFVVEDDGSRVALTMDSEDGEASVKVIGSVSDSLPASSCFGSLEEASAFFEKGCIGYSTRAHDGSCFDGLLLKTNKWHVQALDVEKVQSSFFDQPPFSEGAAEFDHALVMRDVPHEWHSVNPIKSEFT